MAVPPSAHDRGPDMAGFRTADISQAMRHDRLAQAKMMNAVRRIVRRILGRENRGQM